jgi:hypothetical protein
VCLALQDRRVRLTSVHVLVFCASVQRTREKTGIERFFADCKEGGMTTLEAYSAFLNGNEPNSSDFVDLKEHFNRAESLLQLQNTWIAIWDKVQCNPYLGLHNQL